MIWSSWNPHLLVFCSALAKSFFNQCVFVVVCSFCFIDQKFSTGSAYRPRPCKQQAIWQFEELEQDPCQNNCNSRTTTTADSSHFISPWRPFWRPLRWDRWGTGRSARGDWRGAPCWGGRRCRALCWGGHWWRAPCCWPQGGGGWSGALCCRCLSGICEEKKQPLLIFPYLPWRHLILLRNHLKLQKKNIPPARHSWRCVFPPPPILPVWPGSNSSSNVAKRRGWTWRRQDATWAGRRKSTCSMRVGCRVLMSTIPFHYSTDIAVEIPDVW